MTLLPPETRRQLQASDPGWDAMRVFLTENDRFLGPRGDWHQLIRDTGGGAYSIWNKNEVYFSASDNSDCNENQRDYDLVCVDMARDGLLYKDLTTALSGCESEILELIRMNATNYNNSFFANFFRYFNNIDAMFQRNRISRPDRIVEIGPGERPYVALRFLIEGASRFIVNDILPIQTTIPSDVRNGLKELIQLIYPHLLDRFERIFLGLEHQGSIPGLETYGQCAFEDIPLGPNDADFIFSVAVLEHVMNPAAVVEKMASIVKPGGHVWHVVDLRDHRNFYDPLRFLQLTSEEYAPIKTENRLRATDHLRLFDANGFEPIELEFSSLLSETVHRTDDIGSATSVAYNNLDAVRPWVSDNLRHEFAPPFNTYDLKDLSVLGLRALYRKRVAS